MIGHLSRLSLLIDNFTGTIGATLGTAKIASLYLEYPAQRQVH